MVFCVTALVASLGSWPRSSVTEVRILMTKKLTPEFLLENELVELKAISEEHRC